MKAMHWPSRSEIRYESGIRDSCSATHCSNVWSVGFNEREITDLATLIVEVAFKLKHVT
jgi:hypothetical protein